MKKFLWALVAGGLLSSCSTVSVTKSQRYPQVYAERPVSILVMPPINRSTKVDAKALFYSSLIVPLSQRGYYVFPPLLTMEILKEESAYDAERRSQVGSGDRSQRIRTYNFPQGRVTDHRIGLTLYKIDSIMDGALDELIDTLVTADQAEKLKRGQQDTI